MIIMSQFITVKIYCPKEPSVNDALVMVIIFIPPQSFPLISVILDINFRLNCRHERILLILIS